MENLDWSLIGHWMPLIVASAAFLIAGVVAIKYKLPAMAGRIDKIEIIAHAQEVTGREMANTVKKIELYGSNGEYKYQHVGDCRKFQAAYYKKIDEVKTDVRGLKLDIKEMINDRIKIDMNLAATMQRVEDMIETNRSNELKAFADLIVKKMNGK